MTKEEFYTKLEQDADIYAYESVMDPEEHTDAVEAIKNDFLEGGVTAWCILNNTNWD